MAGLGTRGTVSGKVYQGGSMWAELDPQYFLPAYPDCLNLNLVSCPPKTLVETLSGSHRKLMHRVWLSQKTNRKDGIFSVEL